MEVQHLKNHSRLITLWHFVGFAIMLAIVVGAARELFVVCKAGGNLYTPVLLLLIGIMLMIGVTYSRVFALKAQDRAIRAEENLRHFVMTGKLFDSRLRIQQIIALRFASDAEFVDLARRAAEENMSQADIKKAIKNWRGDYYRV